MICEVREERDVWCLADPFTDILPSGFLALLWSFAESIDFFRLFREMLHVDMKEVEFSNLDKVKTLIASIVVGCQYGKDINHKLVPYQAAAQCCRLEQFSDQSQINRFLRRLTIFNIQELDYIFEQMLRSYGMCRFQSRVDVDYDCTGLTVYGKTYQFARKGYFPKKRSSRGYQLSLATTANTAYHEILSLHLDPGNVHHDCRFWDAIYQAGEVLGDISRIGVVRADSASGTGPNIEALIDHGLSYLIKGKDCRTAKRFADKLCYEDWRPADLFIRVSDLDGQRIPNCRHPVRVVVVETSVPTGGKKYTALYTDLGDEPEELFHRYNGRQSIESIIREDKYGLYITHLRTREYLGLLGFLYLAMITYNLLSLFRHTVLRGTGLERISISGMTNKLMDIPAKMFIEDKQLLLGFPERHELCKKLFSKRNL